MSATSGTDKSDSGRAAAAAATTGGDMMAEAPEVTGAGETTAETDALDSDSVTSNVGCRMQAILRTFFGTLAQTTGRVTHAGVPSQRSRDC